MNSIAEKLNEIESRSAPENLVFLRPHGAIVALCKIMETRKVREDIAKVVAESIRESTAGIDQLLWTVPQARSFFRKMIVEYLDTAEQNEPDLLGGFLRHFQSKPMPNALRSRLSIHLHENSEGLSSALDIWSELHRL